MNARADAGAESGDVTGLGHVAQRYAIDVSHGPILYLEDISVSFGGFRALNRLNLTVDAGELRCIIGPNGAGKTTMMDVITGKTRADCGTAFLGQALDLGKMTEPQIARAGIGRKFQKPSVFESHSVFENLELAGNADKRAWSTLFRRRSSEETDCIHAMLDTIGLRGVEARLAGALSHGQKQWLEIGMLLMQDPQLLLLDEPVAGMTDEERARTAELFLSLAGSRSLVVVDHDMEFIDSIAHRVTVLHEGHVLAEGDMAQIRNDERVIEVYLGR